MTDDRMTERAEQLSSSSQAAGGTSRQGAENELLGAVHIVEAFTALRHELKLQVRSGRELQQSWVDSVKLLEQRLATLQPLQVSGGSAESERELAEALAEVEESLQRAVETIARQDQAAATESELLKDFDAAVAAAPWLARQFAGGLLRDLRARIMQSGDQQRSSQAQAQTIRQGLELLLARVHRLMRQCQMERVDVLQQPFNADWMHAVDVIEAGTVPASHVAEQLRPAYRWRGKILRCAQVRIAR
jgi:molecular chaperone GrpE